MTDFEKENTEIDNVLPIKMHLYDQKVALQGSTTRVQCCKKPKIFKSLNT